MRTIKGQTVIENAVTLIIIVVCIFIVAILSASTTPLVNNLVTAFNITGGQGVVAKHFNLIMIFVLSVLGLILVYFIGGRQQ